MRLPWSSRDPAEAARQLLATFRRVFGTEDGMSVLTVILSDLKLNQKAASPEDKALKEYATFFLQERLGVKGTMALVEKIMEIPPLA